jgi:uncharacterized DUF497 family protein
VIAPIEWFDDRYPEFEWDEQKRAETLEARGIDFADVARHFFGSGLLLRRRADRRGELRWQALGPFRGQRRLLSVVYTERDEGSTCRIISVRAARDDEEEAYYGEIQEG